jgi:hypothetical protein
MSDKGSRGCISRPVSAKNDFDANSSDHMLGDLGSGGMAEVFWLSPWQL